ncbi:MAG: transglutaminase domain-containing protein [Bacteroidota bacterium]
MNFRKYLIFIFVFRLGILFSQAPADPDLLEYSDKDIHTGKRTGADAVRLVKKLIKGKSGEQEKFDAIFTWVTTNIKYNYSEFYLPTASNPEQISRILKTKNTICLGYANLMDTLCKLAGIANVTVYGYAKDEFFDIHDTVYIHNHAWNAVRLDGLWYVYDATWSKGKVEYELTRFSRRVIRWFERHPDKLKKKKLRNRFSRRIKYMCGETPVTPVFYYKRRWLSQIIHNWVGLLPIRTRKVFKKGITKDYYLSEPRLFALTHISDDPTWNLSDTRNFRAFETDSAYFYFSDSILKSQNHQGIECADCDLYAKAGIKERLKALNMKSSAFNKHNHFITNLCEEQIGIINWKQAIVEKDSLSQMQFLDSTTASFSNAYYSLRKTKDDLKSLVLMHKVKNKHKMSLLLTDNKMHTLFMSGRIRLTIKHTQTYSILMSQGGAYAHTYLKKASRTKRFKINIRTDKLKPYPEKTLNAIHKDLEKKELQLDSLQTLIHAKQTEFDSLIIGVSLNIWQQVNYHDSISVPFNKSINLRRQLKDNYKKTVIDIRKTIPGCELTYGNNLKYTVYQPSEEALILFKVITSAIKNKTKLQNECLQYNRELLRAKELSYDGLKQYKDDIIKDSELDFCWIAGNYSRLATIWIGLKTLKTKQSHVIDLINHENDIERHRHYLVNRSVQYGSREALKSLSFEIRDVKKALKGVRQYRKNILKKKR